MILPFSITIGLNSNTIIVPGVSGQKVSFYSFWLVPTLGALLEFKDGVNSFSPKLGPYTTVSGSVYNCRFGDTLGQLAIGSSGADLKLHSDVAVDVAGFIEFTQG